MFQVLLVCRSAVSQHLRYSGTVCRQAVGICLFCLYGFFFSPACGCLHKQQGWKILLQLQLNSCPCARRAVPCHVLFLPVTSLHLFPCTSCSRAVITQRTWSDPGRHTWDLPLLSGSGGWEGGGRPISHLMVFNQTTRTTLGQTRVLLGKN